MSPEDRLRDSLEGASRIGILHHWDADGIASAAAIIKLSRERGIAWENLSPAVGDYSDYASHIRQMVGKEPDLLVGLDLSMTASNLDAVERAASGTKAVWVDHHANPPSPHEGVEYFHPEVLGYGEQPSSAWFLSMLLGTDNLLAAIGTRGDLGQGLTDSEYLEPVERIASGRGLNIEQLFQITDLLDSNYRAGNILGVARAPGVLAQHVDEPSALLNNAEWIGNQDAVNSELKRIMEEEPSERGNVMVRLFSTDMHLTSIVARQIAFWRKDGLAVIASNVGRDPSPFYVRRIDPSINLTPLIEMGRSRGYSAGGKPQVVGMVVPRGQTEAAIDDVVAALEELK